MNGVCFFKKCKLDCSSVENDGVFREEAHAHTLKLTFFLLLFIFFNPSYKDVGAQGLKT